MPLSAAERQRRYKEKMKKDPEKYDEYKKKKRVNYHLKKRLIKDLTPKEKHNARVIWKIRKQNLRRNRKNLNRVLDMTPPCSPSILAPDADLPPEALQMLEQNDKVGNMSGIETPENSVTHKVETKNSGRRKRLRRDRSKLYRENLKLQEENEKLRKKCEKYKKRCQRTECNKNKKIKPDEKDNYKKLTNAIKDKYQKTKKNKEKKVLKDIFEGFADSARKKVIKESLGLTGLIRTTTKVHNSATKLKKTIEQFFLREDVSRATAGKKETMTKHGEKIQKRYLLDNMKNLYKTFLLENPGVKCSYYYLTRNKPFYVIKPSVSGREMCLCKTHINPAYKASALKNKGVISSDDLNKLIAATVCNPKEEACMYGTCSQCHDLKIEPNDDKVTSTIQWKEWGRVEESYEKDGKKLKVLKNVKLEKKGNVKELVREFNKELKILKKHVYNMKVQFANFRLAVDNLQQSEAVIVADFSENYSCKHNEEIQAHHFGGSRQQVSLHTVVVYVRRENNKKIESYCTVSSNTNHQPAAIWAHLDPVLKDIRSCFPEVMVIHFFTDGPFSQYRQKQNFYLGSTALFDYGFQAMTWSFFEAGHGKGPADGIGGYLKRSADDLVARGEDITCAYKFYEVLKDISKIKLHLIFTDVIENIAKQIPTKIQPLVGTKDVHQIFTAIRGELKYRKLSCFCTRGFCECLSPRTYRPLVFVPIGLTKKHKKSYINNLVEEENKTEITKDVNESEASKKNTENDETTAENFNGNTLISNNTFDNDVTSIMNSDEDQPLRNYGVSQQRSPLKEIGLLELAQVRSKNWYNIVYKTPDTSDDETITTSQKPSTSMQHSNYNESRGVTRGDFLLVNVNATKGKTFKYACIVNDLHEDGEIRVTFLRSTKKKTNYTFRLEKSDVSDIDYTDIVKILPEPKICTKRGQQYYMFENNVDVFEK